MARPVVLIAAGVVVLAALAVAGLWALQRQLVYLPDRAPLPPAATVLPGASDVVLQTEDGLHLGAWYLPAPAAEAPAVLVASGNGGSRQSRAPLARGLAEQGLSVLLFDYRGYGGNPGRPSEQGLARDVRAARRFLLEVAGVPHDRLLYFGESLGAAVVTELAREHPPAGLVLRSPFEDLASVGTAHYRGYGGNPGSPSEQGLARDVRAARRFLLEVARVPNDRLLYFGESLGAAVVTELASEHPPAGLVLRSPFQDLASVGSVHYPLLPVRALLRDTYPLAQHIAEVAAPTTVIYGTADSIVPPEQSQAVADAAATLHQLIPIRGADHNDLVLVAGNDVIRAVVDLADASGAR